MVYISAMFPVKQLSRLAGVTPRTLHHYDDIELLKPTQVGKKDYRYYGQVAILLLKQILFYRKLDLPLEEIKKIMGRPEFDALDALQSHRNELQSRIIRLNRLIKTVENTIDHLKGA